MPGPFGVALSSPVGGARCRRSASRHRIAAIAPALPLVQLLVARLASSLGDMDTARPAIRAALATASAKAHRYHCRVAAMLLGLQDLAAAEACLESASRAFPHSSRVRLLLAELERYRGKTDKAVRCYEQSLVLAATTGEQLQALAGLAGCTADTGRTDKAVAVSRRMIELSPNNAEGYYHLVNCQRGADLPDDTIEHMVRMLSSKSLPSGQRMSLHYSLAAVYDGRGDHAEAFAHLASANGTRVGSGGGRRRCRSRNNWKRRSRSSIPSSSRQCRSTVARTIFSSQWSASHDPGRR